MFRKMRVKELYNKDTTKELKQDLVLLTTRKELALRSGSPRGIGGKTAHAFSYTFEVSIILRSSSTSSTNRALGLMALSLRTFGHGALG
jgi:hypothetical protein